MDKKHYVVSRVKNTGEVIYFEYDKVQGYRVNPKTKKDDTIGVSKIIFVNDSMSEKIIRRKINKKIAYLLSQLKLIEDDSNPDESGIKKNLMVAEKLKLQIINNYVKYLGHTYHSLTLKKIQIIINQLRYKLYTIRDIERENNLFVERENNFLDYSEGRRSR